jgi:hypothetical protein
MLSTYYIVLDQFKISLVKQQLFRFGFALLIFVIGTGAYIYIRKTRPEETDEEMVSTFRVNF